MRASLESWTSLCDDKYEDMCTGGVWGRKPRCEWVLPPSSTKAPFEDERRVDRKLWKKAGYISSAWTRPTYLSIQASSNCSVTSPMKNLCRAAKVTHQHAFPSCGLALVLATQPA